MSRSPISEGNAWIYQKYSQDQDRREAVACAGERSAHRSMGGASREVVRMNAAMAPERSDANIVGTQGHAAEDCVTTGSCVRDSSTVVRVEQLLSLGATPVFAT